MFDIIVVTSDRRIERREVEVEEREIAIGFAKHHTRIINSDMRVNNNVMAFVIDSNYDVDSHEYFAMSANPRTYAAIVMGGSVVYERDIERDFEG